MVRIARRRFFSAVPGGVFLVYDVECQTCGNVARIKVGDHASLETSRELATRHRRAHAEVNRTLGLTPNRHGEVL